MVSWSVTKSSGRTYPGCVRPHLSSSRLPLPPGANLKGEVKATSLLNVGIHGNNVYEKLASPSPRSGSLPSDTKSSSGRTLEGLLHSRRHSGHGWTNQTRSAIPAEVPAEGNRGDVLYDIAVFRTYRLGPHEWSPYA